MKLAGFAVGVGLGVLAFAVIYRLNRGAIIDRAVYEVGEAIRRQPAAEGTIVGLFGPGIVEGIQIGVRNTLESELP